MNSDEMTSQEKIARVTRQDVPEIDGAVLLAERQSRYYDVSVYRQEAGTFSFEEKPCVHVDCMAGNFEEAAEAASLALTGSSSYQNTEKHAFECGGWYSGNKYRLIIESLGQTKKGSETDRPIIDTRPLKTKEGEKWKERRRENRKMLEESDKNLGKKVIIFRTPMLAQFYRKMSKIDNVPSYIKLPSIDKNSRKPREVRSSSDRSVFYLVDLKDLVCGCSDFVKQKRYLYELDDPRRLCKHLKSEYQKVVSSDDDEILFFWNCGLRKRIIERTFEGGQIYYITFDSRKDDWINVIARKRLPGEKGGNYTGKYEMYGWNQKEGRWSYGDGPDGAREIKKALSTILQ